MSQTTVADPQVELFNQVKALLPSIHGWCSPEKAELMMRIIYQSKPSVCVEIGVFGGSSLLPQAMALKLNGKGIIHGIDPWSTDAALQEMIGQEHKEWWTQVRLEDIMRHCQDNISKLNLYNQVHLIRAKAEDAVSQFADNSIDILHIDGNHSEPLAYLDATLYLPKVKSGGFIFFDDIWWAEEVVDGQPKVTTRKAVMFLLESCERQQLVGDCMLLKKN